MIYPLGSPGGGASSTPRFEVRMVDHSVGRSTSRRASHLMLLKGTRPSRAMPSEPPVSSSPKSQRAFPPVDPRSALGRLLIPLAVGLIAGIELPGRLSWPFRITIGWDLGALLMLGLIWLFVMTTQSTTTRCRAAAADPG